MPGTAWRGVIEEYRSFLPVTDATPVVTLLEGATPLLPAPRLSERLNATVETGGGALVVPAAAVGPGGAGHDPAASLIHHSETGPGHPPARPPGWCPTSSPG